MSKVVMIQQTMFLPRLHQLKRIVDSDVFVLMDATELGKHCENRTPIRLGENKHWLIVPLEKRKQGMLISRVRIAWETGWVESALKTILHGYGKALFFDEWYAHVVDRLNMKSEWLLDYDVDMLMWLLEVLKIRTPMRMQSELGECDQKKGELMLELTRRVGGDVYHCGSEAPGRIIDVDRFKEGGVEVKIQQWDTPEYEQIGEGFMADLSVIDALFNVGLQRTQQILGIR